MSPRPIPTRHWRSYGTEPLPTGAGVLDFGADVGK
jgi:hypothetical protein